MQSFVLSDRTAAHPWGAPLVHVPVRAFRASYLSTGSARCVELAAGAAHLSTEDPVVGYASGALHKESSNVKSSRAQDKRTEIPGFVGQFSRKTLRIEADDKHKHNQTDASLFWSQGRKIAESWQRQGDRAVTETLPCNNNGLARASLDAQFSLGAALQKVCSKSISV